MLFFQYLSRWPLKPSEGITERTTLIVNLFIWVGGAVLFWKLIRG